MCFHSMQELAQPLPSLEFNQCSSCCSMVFRSSGQSWRGSPKLQIYLKLRRFMYGRKCIKKKKSNQQQAIPSLGGKRPAPQHHPSHLHLDLHRQRSLIPDDVMGTGSLWADGAVELRQ